MKKFLIPISFLAIIFWSIFLLILFFVPPEIDSQLVIPNLIYFFLSGYLAVALSSSLVLYCWQTLLKLPHLENTDQERILKKRTRSSLRKGFLFSSALLILAILQLTKTNSYLNTFLVIIIVVLFEIYWSNR